MAANTPNPTGPGAKENPRFARLVLDQFVLDQCPATPNIVMEHSAPLKLNINAGDKNVPINKLPTSTRKAATQAAVFQPNIINATRVITLAKPGFTPGRGLGKALSATWMVMASAASAAIMTSSRWLWIMDFI